MHALFNTVTPYDDINYYYYYYCPRIVSDIIYYIVIKLYAKPS